MDRRPWLRCLNNFHYMLSVANKHCRIKLWARLAVAQGPPYISWRNSFSFLSFQVRLNWTKRCLNCISWVWKHNYCSTDCISSTLSVPRPRVLWCPRLSPPLLWFAQNQPQILDNCPHFCNRTENLRCFFLAKCTLPELCCRFFYFLVFQGGGPPLLTADEGLYSYVNPALINQPVLIIQPCIGVETAGTISAV